MRTLEVAAGPSRLWVGVIAAAIVVVCIMASVLIATRSSASVDGQRIESDAAAALATPSPRATPAL